MSHLNEVSCIQNYPSEDQFLEMCEDTVKCNTLPREEDYVWINLPEVERNHRIRDNALFETNKEDQLLLVNRSSNNNMVQSSSKEEFPDPNGYDSDSLLEEEIIDNEYISKCPKNKVKSVQSHKSRYPNLHKLKKQECGNYKIENRQNVNETQYKCYRGQIKELLPKTKLDAQSTQVLEMLITKRYLGQFNGVVGTGKRSIVFHANCNDNICVTMPVQNAVKVYKISRDEAKNEIIYKQVQKEYEHMNILYRSRKLRDHSIWAVKTIKNVIVMQFMACNEPFVRAPNIAELPCEADLVTYNAVIHIIDGCYNHENLVHGNLSAKKVLCWWRRPDAPHFVGWSDSVKRNHPMALSKLMKDCRFVTEFYKSRGLAVKPTIELFKQITGQKTVDAKLIEIVEGRNLYNKYNTNPNRRNPSKPTNMRFK